MRRLLMMLLMLLLSANFISAQEVLDKIVAVIGDEIILYSELQQETAYYAAQHKLDMNDPKLKEEILNHKVEEKLLYAQAKLDSISISDDEVKDQIDRQLNYFIQQYGSAERIEEAYGMKLEQIKREMREETKKNLMAQRVRQTKFGMLDISRKEVIDFFKENKDSMGVIPEKFEIAHIFMNPQNNEEIMKRAKEKAQALLDSIKAGADFAKLAKENSDDPGSAAKGGDLGFVARGVFFPEFESAAYALVEGELSDVVESPVGYHIIQLIERKGEKINTRHILVKPKADSDSDLEVIRELSSIRDSIVSGENTFAYYAKKYSEDEQTAALGGKLGTFEKSQLEKPLLDQVYKLKDGEIGFPKRLEVGRDTYGYHILKLIKRIPRHEPTIEEDYQEIKQSAEYMKREKMYADWIKDLKTKIFWEIRL